MRRSIALRCISLSGFALWEYLQKLRSVSKLPGAVFTNIPAWLNFRKVFEKFPCIFGKQPV